MRIDQALAVSVAIHALALSVPVGSLDHLSSLAGSEAHRSRSRPAALSVSLGRFPLAAPIRVATTAPAAPQTDPVAAAISDEETGDGGATIVEEAVAAPTEPSFGIPAPRYYGPKEVSRRATPIDEIDPSPPALVGIPGAGRLVLALWLSEAGLVERIEVESAQVDEAIRTVVVNQFRTVRFAPAEIDGQPVKSRMRIEVVVRSPVPR